MRGRWVGVVLGGDVCLPIDGLRDYSWRWRGARWRCRGCACVDGCADGAKGSHQRTAKDHDHEPGEDEGQDQPQQHPVEAVRHYSTPPVARRAAVADAVFCRGQQATADVRRNRGSGRGRAWGGGLQFRQRAKHRAQRITVDQLDVPAPGGRFPCIPGELTTGSEDGAGGALVDHDAEQLVHFVMRHLLGVPVLALDDDVLAEPPQLEVDAAIEPGTRTAGADMLDLPAFAAVVIGQQYFQSIPSYAGQVVVPAATHILETVHVALPTSLHSIPRSELWIMATT